MQSSLRANLLAELAALWSRAPWGHGGHCLPPAPPPLTQSGLCQSQGSVHKHFNKGNRQNRDLAKTQVLYETYAKTMRKLGFTMRSF